MRVIAIGAGDDSVSAPVTKYAKDIVNELRGQMIHVSADFGCNSAGDGTQANPYPTISRALQSVLEVRSACTEGNNEGPMLSGVNDYYVPDCQFRMSAGCSGIDPVSCIAV